MCWAIASSTATLVASQLIVHGESRRAYLGMGGQNVPLLCRVVRQHNLSVASGVLVVTVEPCSPAHRAGLQEGDVLIAYDGQAIADIDALHRRLTEQQRGTHGRVPMLRHAAQQERTSVPEASQRYVWGSTARCRHGVRWCSHVQVHSPQPPARRPRAAGP